MLFHSGVRLWANSTSDPLESNDAAQVKVADALVDWGNRKGGDHSFKPRLRWWARFTAACLLGGFTLGCAGMVLDREQKSELANLNSQLKKTTSSILAAQTEMDAMAPLYDEVKAAIEQAIVDRDLDALTALYEKRDDMDVAKDIIASRIQDLYTNAKGIQKAQSKVMESGVPWYMVAGSWTLNIVGLLSGLGLLGKMGTMGKVIGVLSRAGDALSVGSANKKAFAHAIEADLADTATPSALKHKDALSAYHKKAKVGKI